MVENVPQKPTETPVPPQSVEEVPVPGVAVDNPVQSVTAPRQATLLECLQMQRKYEADLKKER